MIGLGWLQNFRQRQAMQVRVEDSIMSKLNAAVIDSRLASQSLAEARTLRVDRAAELRQTLTDLLRKLT